jgi:hypothetical protein
LSSLLRRGGARYRELRAERSLDGRCSVRPARVFLLERRGRRPGKGFLVPLLVGQLYGSDIVVTAVFEGREVTNGIILYLNIRISLAFVSPGSLTGHFNSLSFLR